MGSDLCGCCGLNMARSPKDDGQNNWLCQTCIDRCPPDGCNIVRRTPIVLHMKPRWHPAVLWLWVRSFLARTPRPDQS